MASTTAASGAPNVADMPAAAPAASRILRSAGDTGMTWPRSEPIDPPVTMIGPSAPNGAPVPMAMAAEIGLAMAIRGATRLCLVSTASMASGMPWPRMFGAQRARRLMSTAPATATGMIGRPSTESVMKSMRWSSTQAAPPPATPRTAAMAVSRRRRRLLCTSQEYRDTI
jgi:hypothetical protein